MLSHATFLEKPHERLHEILVGGDGGYIDMTPLHRVTHVLLPLIPPLVVGLAHLGRGGVDPAVGSSLKVGNPHESHIGQLCVAFVVDLYGRDIMLVVGYGESLVVVVGVDVVGDEKRRASFLERVGKVSQHCGDVCATVFGGEIEQLADDEQDVAATLLRRDEFLNLVGEEYHTNLVVVLNCRKCQCGGNLGNHLALVYAHCAEVAAARYIDKQHDGQLTLLLVDFHIGMVVACGDVPVDVADVVAILIFAHLRECHATPLEGRVVFAREYVLGQSTGLYLDFADLFQQFISIHNQSVSVGLKGDMSSGHLNLVEYIGDDFVGGDVVGLGLVGDADAVTEHVVAYGADILGYHVSATAQESVGP